MKKGIHYWALPTDMSLKEKFDFSHECGFDGIELVILEQGGLEESMKDSQLREIRKQADDSGIEIPSLTNSLNWKSSFTSDDRKIRQLACDNVRRGIDIAAELCVEVLQVIPGFVAFDMNVNGLHPSTKTVELNDYSPSLEVVRYDVAYDRALEGISKVADYAKSTGVMLGIENVWNNFLLSPLEMRDFLDEINSPNISSFFDVGNVRPLGIPQQWIHILGNRIKRVHIKDYTDGLVELSSFTELGKGNIDFNAVYDALDEIGYDGWVSAEVNVDSISPKRVAFETADFMKRIEKRRLRF